MKRAFSLFILLSLALSATARTQAGLSTSADTGIRSEAVEGVDTFETAEEAVAHAGLGWNLGNTLDSNSGDVENMWIERWTNRTPADYEKAWRQVPTTQAFIDMMRDAGIKAVRVPVTWYPHMVRNWAFVDDGTVWDQEKAPMERFVSRSWMRRVKQTVDYVINSGMYCILNVHHDTGASNTAWIRASMDRYDSNHELYEYLWQCIAEEFKDYDGRLLFEGYNEMLDEKGSWCFATLNYPGYYDAEAASDAYDAVNHYAQSFVNAVRATGGNNARRNLIVNTYGCCNGGGTWNSHLLEPLTNMDLPHDDAADHLIFQVHYYPIFSTLDEGKADADALFDRLKSHLVANGAPVIVGEWGADSSSPVRYDNNNETYLEWVKYFVRQAKENGIGTFLWMGLSDGEARAVPEWSQPDLLEAMVEGYYGEEGAAIEEVRRDNEDGERPAVYDLLGRKLDSMPRKGLCIVGGRKIFVSRP